MSASLIEGGLNKPHVVVLDPPRQGAGVAVVEALLRLRELGAGSVYVSCDAASFAHDLRGGAGQRLDTRVGSCGSICSR